MASGGRVDRRLVAVGVLLAIGALVAIALVPDPSPAPTTPEQDPLVIPPSCPHLEDRSDPTACAAADAADSSLKMAATAEESYAVANNGAYTNEIADLEAEGWRADPDVILTIIQPNGGGEASSYCIEAEHASLPFTLRYSSEAGLVEIGGCPP